jgi:hypothetical protein
MMMQLIDAYGSLLKGLFKVLHDNNKLKINKITISDGSARMAT